MPSVAQLRKPDRSLLGSLLDELSVEPAQPPAKAAEPAALVPSPPSSMTRPASGRALGPSSPWGLALRALAGERVAAEPAPPPGRSLPLAARPWAEALGLLRGEAPPPPESGRRYESRASRSPVLSLDELVRSSDFLATRLPTGVTMNQQIRETLRSAEGRYLTTDEGRLLLDEARQLERRLAVMRSVEQKEREIVERTVDRVFQQYPRFYQERPQAQEKCERDVSLTLRYCALAMVSNDPQLLTEKLLHWMKSVLRALDMTDICRATYQALEESVSKSLPPADAAELNRYVHLCVEAFSS